MTDKKTVNQHDLAIIKHFVDLQFPFWIIGLPVFGLYVYLKLQRCLFKKLQDKTYVCRLYNKYTGIFFGMYGVVFSLGGLVFITFLLLNLEERLNFSQPPYSYGIAGIVSYYVCSAITFSLQPVLVKKSHHKIWSSYLTYYQIDISQVTIPKLVFDNQSFVNNILQNFAKIDVYSFIYPEKLQVADKFLYVPHALEGIQFKMPEAEWQQKVYEFEKQPKAYHQMNIFGTNRNYLLKSSLFTYFSFLYLLDSLQPSQSLPFLKKVIVINYFRFFVSHTLIAAIVTSSLFLAAHILHLALLAGITSG